MYRPILLFCLLVSGGFTLQLGAQYTAVTDIPVTVEGKQLQYPLAGGTEAPQFAHFDLDSDSLPDLLVFDRVGSKIIPFRAFQAEEGVQYQYAPEYLSLFPEMYQLMELKDLNCDGLKDLITTRQLGVSAAEVTLVAHLQQPEGGFEAGVDFQLQGNPSDSILRTHAFDRPALEDIDGDGLIDLLYIPLGGTKIQYYRNVSESSGGCNAMQFALEDDCWGLASYTLTADFELQSCEPGVPPGRQGCAGSTMLARDYDGDGDKDLYFSGLYDYEILQLTNGGDNNFADLINQSPFWLNSGQPLLVFPSPFFLDLYEDGEADLLVAGNGIGGIGNSPESDKLFHFTADENGNWQYQSADFLISEMIDFGFRSSPAVWDVNLDGLPDLLLAFNQPHPVFSYTARIAYFKNTGSSSAPAFELESMDFAGLSAFNYKSIHPCFDDLDGDGLPELLIGTENGKLELFTNLQAGTDSYVPVASAPLNSIVLNGLAKPQLVDLNKDGRLDIVAGTRNGTLSYVENTGTLDMPQFEWITDTLADIVPDAFFQESSVFVQAVDEGNFELYFGRKDGTLDLYTGNLENGFEQVNSHLGRIDVGERIAMSLQDLDQDGMLEIITGNMRGGVEIFRQEQLISSTHRMPEIQHSAFPNPFSSQLTFTAHHSSEKLEVLLFDMLGRLVSRGHMDGKILQVDTQHLLPGMYFYQLMSRGKVRAAGKLIRQ
jgi:hypothetical protein